MSRHPRFADDKALQLAEAERNRRLANRAQHYFDFIKERGELPDYIEWLLRKANAPEEHIAVAVAAMRTATPPDPKDTTRS